MADPWKPVNFNDPLPSEWDDGLCNLCNRTDFRLLFGPATWDNNFSVSGFSEGGGKGFCPRTYAYNRDHQSCPFCRLTYQALKITDNWYNIEKHAVWLTPRVPAWFLSGTSGPWPSRVEKKLWLRIQRGTLGLDDFWDERKEVLMEQVAQIQLLAAQPTCTTGSAVSDIALRNKLNGVRWYL